MPWWCTAGGVACSVDPNNVDRACVRIVGGMCQHVNGWWYQSDPSGNGGYEMCNGQPCTPPEGWGNPDSPGGWM